MRRFPLNFNCCVKKDRLKVKCVKGQRANSNCLECRLNQVDNSSDVADVLILKRAFQSKSGRNLCTKTYSAPSTFRTMHFLRHGITSDEFIPCLSDWLEKIGFSRPGKDAVLYVPDVTRSDLEYPSNACRCVQRSETYRCDFKIFVLDWESTSVYK